MSNLPEYLLNSSPAHAILETLAYFDVFDFPVQEAELHRYLHGLQAPLPVLRDSLHSLIVSGRIELCDGYVVLAGRGSLIDSYEAGAVQNARALHLALRYGRILARLPFVRMVAVTGSVAMQNGGPDGDYDYLLVTRAGRLWLGRAFAILLGRWAGLRGHTLCPNIILSEHSLLWPRQDVYAAHELAQMIPVSGFHLYRRLRQLNSWTREYLPNADGAPSSEAFDQPRTGAWQRLVEALLPAPIGDAWEHIEMRRKVARFSRQTGFGVETFFSADVCQGNFQHHGGQTRWAFERRLEDLGLPPVATATPSDSWASSPSIALRSPGPTSPAARPRRIHHQSEHSAVAHD